MACVPLSSSAQGCDQVARDSLMAGRGPCPFLVTCPVRTLNSNPAPTRAYLREASSCRHKPKSHPNAWQVLRAGTGRLRGDRRLILASPLLPPIRHSLCGPPHPSHGAVPGVSPSWTPPLLFPHFTLPWSSGIYYRLYASVYACLSSPLGQKLVKDWVRSSPSLNL